MSLEMERATWVEVGETVKRTKLALLPVGVLEQHGPHLPLSSDNIIATELTRRVAERIDCLVLPVVPYGPLYSFRDFPGSLWVKPEIFKLYVKDICLSLQHHGIETVAIIVGHMTDYAPMKEMARELQLEAGLKVVPLLLPGLESAMEQVCESEPAHPGIIHADEVETSLVLAARPEWVHMDRSVREYPEFPPYFDYLPFSWYQRVCKTGVFGDATVGTREKGDAMYRAMAERIVEILKSVEEYRP